MSQDSAAMTGRLLRLPKVQAALKGLLLLGLGIFLFTRITSGTLNYYISQRFDWLTIAAVLGLIVVGLSYRYLLQEADDTLAAPDDHAPERLGEAGSRDAGYSHQHSHGHDYDHGHSHALSWSGFLLISLPIILGLLVPPRPLGVAALQNREISAGGLNSVLPAAVGSSLVQESGERTILDWVLAFHQGERPAETDTADVVGFVYLDDAADEVEFTLTRFVVGCCAADAMAVGLPVSLAAGRPSGEELEEGQWVRVVGQFAASTGNSIPVLVAEQLEAVPEPNQPYLYP
ncbi:MAG: TIGR03943 family protein [Caldilineaceae bacterium]|nr:TIGR03943 family protein [Caldilineaceae bacterium]